MTPPPGQVAYEAFWQMFVPAFGTDIDPWETLSPSTQRCWDAAAQAVLAHALPAAPTPTPGQVAIDRDVFEHLLTCLANQKFLHEMAGSLDWETRQQAKDFQAIIDVAWRRGMDLLQSPEGTPC